MTTEQLQEKLYEFIRPSYPDIKINVVDTVENVRQLYFTDDRFELLYPKQRYHYLTHLIPSDFYDQNLQSTEWFELAPNEKPDELDYHDQETIDEIKEPILSILKDKVGFVSLLDKKFISENAKCFGDFRHSKKILTDLKFSDQDQFDIFHVLMNEGAYCDCEILYNVFRDSEYTKQYWRDRQE
ncbi:DUF2695 domain-containing protein [Rhizosphaericola mali]|uniref:DUF2695 domain-containing protein n=1 Tax=Rhizosphaericola mali TaxID=2545455 RepID=A0A5P2GAV2_9BACT|nr:DUF2695 domain-containing protein [Rhizosphaericola mali]QES91052.1 DUF2695 domain-containing protein [Rhizosphaericola mali]